MTSAERRSQNPRLFKYQDKTYANDVSASWSAHDNLISTHSTLHMTSYERARLEIGTVSLLLLEFADEER